MPTEQFLPTQAIVAIQEYSEDPSKQLCEALLWRGFLAGRLPGGEVGLYRGSHSDNLPILSKLGCDVEPIATGEFVATIRCRNGRSASELSGRIIQLPPRNAGMLSALKVPASESAFFKCIYGRKCPTVNLDPGVALMVKVFPVCGLLTVHSCQGHPKEGSPDWPEINFHSKPHLDWAVMVISELANHLDAFKNLAWHISEEKGGWLTWKIIFAPDATTPGNEVFGDEYWNTLTKLQFAARELLRPEVYERIRSAKAAVQHVSELEGTLKNSLKGLPDRQ